MFKMSLKSTINFMLVSLFLPVLISSIFMPVISKYFIELASVELISSSRMVDQSLVMILAFIGCWSRGMKIFLRIYYPIWVFVICIDIIIAVAGVEHVEMRFYLYAIQIALDIGIVSQSLNYYAMAVIPRDQLQLLSNKERTVVGLSGIIGSFIAFLLGAIDIQIALWINVLFTIIDFSINTTVLINFKRIAKEQEEEK